MAVNTKEIDEDPDLDEEGEEDLEQFTLPDALLKAAGIESDEDWDELPAVEIRQPKPGDVWP